MPVSKILAKKMKKYFFAFVFCLISMHSFSQSKVTINGYIKDSLTGETLIGATLSVRAQGNGVTSNQYGFYSLTISKGAYKLLCSFVGYETKELLINLDSSMRINIDLIPKSFIAENVTVTGMRRENN